jgi:hypothetical protein
MVDLPTPPFKFITQTAIGPFGLAIFSSPLPPVSLRSCPSVALFFCLAQVSCGTKAGMRRCKLRRGNAGRATADCLEGDGQAVCFGTYGR